MKKYSSKIKNSGFDENLGRKYFPIDYEFNFGDSSLTTDSLLIPPLKWAWEFENNNNNKDKHPVTFIEHCSIYKRIESNRFHLTDLTKNDYRGLACNCLEQQNAFSCKHDQGISEDHYVNLISILAVQAERVHKPLTRTQLAKITSCPDFLTPS